jgi:hypothetical protein
MSFTGLLEEAINQVGSFRGAVAGKEGYFDEECTALNELKRDALTMLRSSRERGVEGSEDLKS